MPIKATPITKSTERMTTTARTMSPAMADKIAAAKAAPPPPVPGAQAAPAGTPAPGAPAAPAAPAQKTTIENPAPGAEAQTPPQDPQLAVLARQTRQLRKAQAELTTRENALKAREADFISKSELVKDPLKVLSAAGVTYDQLVQAQLGEPAADDPVAVLKAEIAELKTQLATQGKTFEDSQANRDLEARAAAVNQLKSDVELLVETDPAYEAIKATGRSADVVELIEKVFDEEGVLLSVQEAASQVEEILVEQTANDVKRFSELTKIKSKLAPKEDPPPQAEPQKPSQAQPRPQTKTLTNSVAVQRPLTARERAILAVEQARNKT